jgi:hypothetical protein
MDDARVRWYQTGHRRWVPEAEQIADHWCRSCRMRRMSVNLWIVQGKAVLWTILGMAP